MRLIVGGRERSRMFAHDKSEITNAAVKLLRSMFVDLVANVKSNFGDDLVMINRHSDVTMWNLRNISGIILDMGSANERRRYNVLSMGSANERRRYNVLGMGSANERRRYNVLGMGSANERRRYNVLGMGSANERRRYNVLGMHLRGW